MPDYRTDTAADLIEYANQRGDSYGYQRHSEFHDAIRAGSLELIVSHLVHERDRLVAELERAKAQAGTKRQCVEVEV